MLQPEFLSLNLQIPESLNLFRCVSLGTVNLANATSTKLIYGRIRLVYHLKSKFFRNPAFIRLGDIFISIPGRLSWTRRWCVLHASVLEIHASTLGVECGNGNASPRPPPPPPPLLLSLPLQPGVVEVALAADKRHPSAVRLSASSLTPLLLLLDAGDTVAMGRWIRAIIEALGHITQSNSVSTPPCTAGTTTSPMSGSEFELNKGCIGVEFLPTSIWRRIRGVVICFRAANIYNAELYLL